MTAGKRYQLAADGAAHKDKIVRCVQFFPTNGCAIVALGNGKRILLTRAEVFAAKGV